MNNDIVKPYHYTWHPSGYECREVNEHLCGNLAAAFKYVYRHNHKGRPVKDIRKAGQHLTYEQNAIFEDMDEKRGGRDLVQRNRRYDVVGMITKMIDHETDKWIIKFYTDLVNAITSSGHAPQTRFLASAAGALIYYRESLEKPAHHPV